MKLLDKEGYEFQTYQPCDQLLDFFIFIIFYYYFYFLNGVTVANIKSISFIFYFLEKNKTLHR